MRASRRALHLLVRAGRAPRWCDAIHIALAIELHRREGGQAREVHFGDPEEASFWSRLLFAFTAVVVDRRRDLPHGFAGRGGGGDVGFLESTFSSFEAVRVFVV